MSPTAAVNELLEIAAESSADDEAESAVAAEEHCYEVLDCTVLRYCYGEQVSQLW